MQDPDLNKRKVLNEVIPKILREEYGIKCKRNWKRTVQFQSEKGKNKIFRIPLHLLELTDAFLANGTVVEIPKFIANASSYILEHVGTEGIFRKAGSAIRQREIRNNLESGLPLEKAYHVIDIANIVKYFFRELPEPLIPLNIQETLVRCISLKNNIINAIILSCLLLPSLNSNTLAFFMQFLYTISLNASENKMSAENLAIILTPSLIPFIGVDRHQCQKHVKVIQLLIENAYSLGTIPKNIAEKLQSFQRKDQNNLEKSERKKKRRTDMLNGLKKLVGSTLGSHENLEQSTEKKRRLSITLGINSRKNHNNELLKGRKEFEEPVTTFIANEKQLNPSQKEHCGYTSENFFLCSLSSERLSQKEAKSSFMEPTSLLNNNKLFESHLHSPTKLVSSEESVKANLDECVKEFTLSKDELSKASHFEVQPNIVKKSAISDQMFESKINIRQGPSAEQITTSFGHEIKFPSNAQKKNRSKNSLKRNGTWTMGSPAQKGNGLRVNRSNSKLQLKRKHSQKEYNSSILKSDLSENLPSVQNFSTTLQPKVAVQKEHLDLIKQINSNGNKTNNVYPATPSTRCKDDFSFLTPHRKDFNKFPQDNALSGRTQKENLDLIKRTNSGDNRKKNVFQATPSTRFKESLDDFSFLTPYTKDFNKFPQNIELSGRESIARLRTENAGMVMAKAKLFDRLCEI